MNSNHNIFLKSLIYIILVVNINLTYAQQKSEIYSPYATENTLAIYGGYCKNSVDEKKLWLELNKYSKSALQVFPQIPPEQKSYINGELKSGNSKRLEGILYSPFYKMNEVYESAENIEKISSLYISNISTISLAKKMEFIGRVLRELDNEGVPYEQTDTVSAELKAKKYFINPIDLKAFWGTNQLFRRTLVSHLICYGGN